MKYHSKSDMMKCAYPRFFVHTTCFFLVCHSWFDIPITIEDIPSEESTQYLLAWIVLFIVVSLTVAKVRMAGVVGEGSRRHSQSPAASPTHHPHLPSPKAFYMTRVHNDEGSHESSAAHSHAYMAWERWSTTAASLMLAGRLKFSHRSSHGFRICVASETPIESLTTHQTSPCALAGLDPALDR